MRLLEGRVFHIGDTWHDLGRVLCTGAIDNAAATGVLGRAGDPSASNWPVVPPSHSFPEKNNTKYVIIHFFY